MTAATGFSPGSVHDGLATRRADAGLLSLALMDARNRTLGWLAAFEGLHPGQALDGFNPPWWLAGQAGWFQEHWIARHVQRGRGAAADPSGLRLASLEPRADAWFSPRHSNTAQRWQQAAPQADELRAYLANTLDTTLDLLDKAGSDDAALYFYRLALLHEDRLAEGLAVLAQALHLAPERHAHLAQRGLWAALPSRGRRDAISLHAQTVLLGSAPGGCVPDAEQWAHPVAVPAFEIDAQPVTWAQYAEFVDDGGYDDRHWWTEAGWAYLQATAKRAPRDVEQVAGGVLALRQGRLQRLPLAQPVLHVSAHEAAAWCRWAGRRLPSEAEWLAAATSASARGFAWGEVLEWVAGVARPYPGGQTGPAALDALPGASNPASNPASSAASSAATPTPAATWRVLRGATVCGAARLRHLQARRFAPADSDALFVGFRSCAA